MPSSGEQTPQETRPKTRTESVATPDGCGLDGLAGMVPAENGESKVKTQIEQHEEKGKK